MKSKETSCTIRDIYYGDTKLFDLLNQQKSVQDTIKMMCLELRIPRNHLGVSAGLSKGLICGWGISIKTGKNTIINLDDVVSNAQVVDDSEIIIRSRGKQPILVIIEKEATFQAIRETIKDKNLIASSENIILLTGKGYPCLETLKYIAWLESKIKPKIKILVDYDPYGLNIALQYKMISNLIINESWAANHCARRIEYIGLSPRIVEKYTMSSFQFNHSSHGLSPRDMAVLRKVREKSKMIQWDEVEKSATSLEDNEQCLELEILYQHNPLDLFLDFIKTEILMTGAEK